MRSMRWLICIVLLTSALQAAESPAPDYSRDIAPLLRKYCAGCHNGTDRDGKLSVESFTDLQQGGEQGAAVLPGDAASSRLIRVLTGVANPAMPPEGEPAPTAAEIELLRAWIDSGAKGPDGVEPDRMSLRVPVIASQTETRPVASVAISPDGDQVAIARYQSVTLAPLTTLSAPEPDTGPQTRRSIGEFPGKVTAVHFDSRGEQLVTASGVTGLGGVAAIWRLSDGKLVREFRGHRDLLYDAELSPDGSVLATCSYDREILLWNAQTGEILQTLTGHNGAVYDIAFSPDGRFLVSASADDTCKVWRVSDGERMDTLGQPLKEQYCVSFSPDGRFIVAGGADNRLRVWRFISTEKPRINPLVVARFAHEGAVLKLAYSADGSKLLSCAEDRTLKIWETRTWTELHLQESPMLVEALAMSRQGGQETFVTGGMDGRVLATRLNDLPLAKVTSSSRHTRLPAAAPLASEEDDSPMSVVEEVEPNNDPSQANAVQLPVRISGVISGRYRDEADSDLFRFSAEAGEEWVLEVNAARSKSPLDSFIEVLDAGGRPIERAVLQAVRDSYFTFRGKNANETGDFRIFNWEEMTLNEFLYANGEVVKLHQYPRGPDSGFIVYPGRGNRWGYFDTTPLAHALGEPCYIVEAHPPGTRPIPNGLPVFPIYYENDDESRRSLGADSKLYFTAPADGEYLVRIRDVRGFEGDDYRYRLTIRPREPDFRVTVHNTDPTVAAGGAREFRVSADRRDGFDGPISVELSGLPPGFSVSSPIVIEADQIEAYGVLSCTADAPEIAPETQGISVSSATAEIEGRLVTHASNGLGKITRGEDPKLTVAILPAQGGAIPVATPDAGPLEFEIQPGETIMLRVAVDRRNHAGIVEFGKEDSGRNLPHGIYVDNIGLNGLMLLEEQNEREFFLTCDKWVPQQSRLFHLQTNAAGGAAALPVLLHVRPERPVAAEGP